MSLTESLADPTNLLTSEFSVMSLSNSNNNGHSESNNDTTLLATSSLASTSSSTATTSTPSRTTIDTSSPNTLGVSPESPSRSSISSERPTNPSSDATDPLSSDEPAVLTKRASIYNRYGQKVIGDVKSPETEDKKKRTVLAQAERARESKWIRMLNSWPEFCVKNPRKLSSRIRKGIPDAVRVRAWSLMLGTDHPDNAAKYAALLEAVADSENRDVIDRDVSRTFSDYVFFRQKEGQSPSQGRSALRNVLRAYACHDKELGYCQGMSFLAGVFLMYATEEQAFWMLEGLLRDSRWQLRGMFLPGFPLLNEYYYILDVLMKEHTPKLRQKNLKSGVVPAMFAQEWFMTLFACCIPFESFLRVMDVLLYKGYKILFQLAIAMLKSMEQSKELASMEFSTLVVSLKGLGGRDKYRESTYAIMDTEQLLKTAFQIQLSTSKLNKLASEAPKKT